MAVIVSGEQPWAGGHTTRYGWWREAEPFWDGTPRWEYVAPAENTFLSMLQRLPVVGALREKVVWLEDTFLCR
jgi:hypothetical protein